jgi:hypothetical protein
MMKQSSTNFYLPEKRWSKPNEETPQDLKGDSQGVLISKFQSREFGFGLDLSKEGLDVNFMRKGEQYRDKHAANIKRQCRETSNDSITFVVEFEFSVANEGYWCYEQTVLQMEDYLGVLHTLYPNLMYYYYLIIPVVIINSKMLG